MVGIQKKLTLYNFSKAENKKNEYIVIHYVGAVSTAKNNADYFYSNRISASSNYFVDETSIWQCVEDYNTAWHCGGPLEGNGGKTFYQKCRNSNSIGIEMCVKKNSNGVWFFEDGTVKNTVDLIIYLMKQYNIPIQNVIRHYDVTGKLCPFPLIDENKWADFKNMILTPTTESNVYNTLEEVPQWGKETIDKLMKKGALKGDENGMLCLSQDMLRILVITDRTGAFEK